MSTIAVTVEQISDIIPHPQADRLEIAKVLGTQTLVPKGTFKPGDKVVFFPPDICLPPDVSENLGVQSYLRSGIYESKKVPCRVAATRLRGTPSYGFAIPATEDLEIGTDVTADYGAWKYEPPIKVVMGGDALPTPVNFHEYTEIENLYRYPTAIANGTAVRVTEKTHGTNARIGYININGCQTLVCGSHHTTWNEYTVTGIQTLYWEPLKDARLRAGIVSLSSRYGNADVIVFCEIFGSKVQDLDYGVPPGQVAYRVFDISVNGRYLNWGELHLTCIALSLPMVPLIYIGPYDSEMVPEWTNGVTALADAEAIKSKFKGREGCVITPLTETYSDVLGGRLILKSVSADYLARKGAKDNA